MEKRLLLIVNPAAGQRRAAKLLADILQLFCDAEYTCTVHMTRFPGDAKALCRRYAADHDLVVCVGGDGTLNEVLDGLIGSGAQTPLGYIHAGSTNDFANSLGLSKDILRATRDILEGTASPVDVGRFNGRVFSYVASCGAFARASYATPQANKNSLGHLAYLLEGIKDLGTLRPVHLRVETEKQVYEDEYILAAISNTTSIGGVLTLDKAKVCVSDGKLELLLIRFPKTLAELNRIVGSLQTRKYDPALISFHSVERLTVFAPKDVPWTLDGEFGGTAEKVEVEVLPGAISWMLKNPLADGQ